MRTEDEIYRRIVKRLEDAADPTQFDVAKKTAHAFAAQELKWVLGLKED
jgi:hypothetical protein